MLPSSGMVLGLCRARPLATVAVVATVLLWGATRQRLSKAEKKLLRAE
jgi:hypothetical protein